MKFDREIQRIQSHGLGLDYFLVPWDSEIFGFPVAQIQSVRVTDEDDAGIAFREFDQWSEANAIHLISCRLDHRLLRESMFLEERGFRFIEMVFSPRLESLQDASFPDGGLEITEVGSDDREQILAIAGSVFDTGRHALDWRLDPKLSDRRYRRWVENSLADPSRRVLKACVGQRVVGFFDVENRSDGCCYWHLTAVAPSWHGKGIGKRLWQAMVMLSKGEGYTRIETTISAHNTPVLNLYARLGFSFQPPEMTFHRVR